MIPKMIVTFRYVDLKRIVIKAQFMWIFFSFILIVPVTSMVFVFFFRDKYDQAINNEPTTEEEKVVRNSAHKRFPKADFEKL